MTGTKEVIKITKEGINTINNALGLYNKVLDQIVPWQKFDETVKELDRYRDDYSNESAELVGKIKTLIKNAQDCYFSATQSIYEWCGLTTKLLAIYLDLFNKRTSKTYEAQRALLIKVLEDGIVKMSAGQDKILQCSAYFNNVSGDLTVLHSRFGNEFNSNSSYVLGKINRIREEAYAGAISGICGGPFGLIISYAIAAGVAEGQLIPELMSRLKEVQNFYDNLKAIIDKTNVDIDSTKRKLQEEVSNIGEMKTQTDSTKTLIPMDELDALRDSILDAVNTLIAQCNEYQKRHGKKN